MDSDSVAKYIALVGRVHALERTSQCCCISRSCPLGLHLAAAGKTDVRPAQGVALEDAQVAVEDVHKDWQHRTTQW